LVSGRRPLYRLFTIYRGEGLKALHFCLFSFLVALVSVCAETLGDGLFLEEVGASGLPLSFLVTALGMFFVSSCLLFALNRHSIHKIIIGTCFVFLLFEAIIYSHLMGWGLAPVGAWLWYALQAGNYMFLTAMFVSHWTFLDRHYDLQDAKRLYGIFNAALITGCAAGSGLVSLFIESIGPHGLLLIIGGLMCATSTYLLFLTRRYEEVADDTFATKSSGDGGSMRQIFRAILNSRFTFLLLISGVVIELISTITEYNYMGALTHYFTADHQLTLFLSRCRTCIYMIDVVVGLFFYSRLVKRFGSSRIFIIPSLYFTLLFAVWPSWTGLAILVLALFAVEGVLYSIDDSNFNLLINAVPSKVRAPVRVVIESFFEPVGMLAGALILLAIEFDSRWLGLALAGVSLLICMALHRGYSKALFANLSANTIHFDRPVGAWLAKIVGADRLTARDSLIRAMGDEKTRDLASEALLLMEEPSDLIDLLDRMEHSPEDRAGRLTRPLLDHPSPAVRKRATASFAKTIESHDGEAWLTQLQTSRDSRDRMAALRALSCLNNPALVRPIILKSVHLRPAERRLAERLLCEMGHRTISILLEMVRDVDLHDRSRLLAGRVLGRLSLEHLRGCVSDLLEIEIRRAYLYLYHYAMIPQHYPDLDLHILTDGLKTRFHSVVDFIIQMVGFTHLRKGGELLSRSLRSHNQKIHSQAVETLRDTCDLSIFRQIEPLVDDRPIEEKVHACAAIGLPLFSLSELLGWLSISSSPADVIISAVLTASIPEAELNLDRSRAAADSRPDPDGPTPLAQEFVS
jgi:hypothetical protein